MQLFNSSILVNFGGKTSFYLNFDLLSKNSFLFFVGLAIAEIIFGAVNPSGRRQIIDIPFI